jgi:hypothetical protein
MLATMSVPAEKALIDMTEAELKDLLRVLAGKEKYLVYGYNDVRLELERRRIEASAKRTFWLSLAAILISVASLITRLLVG